MASPMLHTIFRAARPTARHEATAFMRTCRTASSVPSDSASRASIHASSHSNSTRKCYGTTRHFSSTLAPRATIVTQNPRADEDGNDMTITISERAAKRLKQITSAPSTKNTLASQPALQDSHLRVAVTSGGCHGFQYLMSLESAEKIDPEEDTVFASEEAQQDGKGGSAKVVLDESSLELLKGSTVDFTTELIGSQFKITGNPRATSSCGCGTSFNIE